ncbi:hypothetical protein C8F01DRAFT_1258436 [Mycena amicta]|nr:hypothetical protein C8F01DRAFT_1258436 [Mycena amicta]
MLPLPHPPVHPPALPPQARLPAPREFALPSPVPTVVVASLDEQPPTKPCARCAAKNLPCEYVPAPESELLSHSYSHWRSPSQPSNNTSSFVSASPPATYSPSPSHAYMAPYPSLPSMYSNPAMSRSGRATPQPLAPPLPYTGPPPVYSRPRYSDGAYPDLALQAQPRSRSDPSPYPYSVAASSYPQSGSGTVNPAQLERSNSTGNENQEDYYFAFSPYGNPGG